MCNETKLETKCAEYEKWLGFRQKMNVLTILLVYGKIKEHRQ